MFHLKSNLFLCAGLMALTMGNVHAKTYQLKKVMLINEVGSGGYTHTDQIAQTTAFITNFLAPKFGFTVTAPATQAAIDLVARDDTLSTYDVVVFNGGTRVGGTGAIGDATAQGAFQRWLKHGHGLVGIHGMMDHNNTWPWMRDTVWNGSIFTNHSNWGSDPNAKVQWDTLKTNGVLNSIKPEYDSMMACFPPLHTKFTYPDEWYSFSVNPRPYTDILTTIDEASYTVPTGDAMGLGHPVSWAFHLPPDSAGNVGRFTYCSRGHETGAWDGTSTNHAPETVAQGAISVNGVVYSDTSHFLMTKGFLWQQIRWAAGLMINDSATSIKVSVSDASPGGILQAQNLNGVLQVHVSSAGSYEVNVYTLSGRNVGHNFGSGEAQYTFSNLKGASMYIVQVKGALRNYSQRVML